MHKVLRNNGRCDGVTRRDFVRVGGLTALGLGLADFLRLRNSVAANELAPRKTRSCILIWLDGGPSHLETFDLKPDAPSEVRGPFQPISTAVPGTRICELLPLTAQRLDWIAIIRSMTSPLGEHNLVVAQLHDERGILPNNIAVPSFRVGGGRLSGQGFLPEQTRPFSVGGDPAKPDFQVRDLDLYTDITPHRLDRRRNFLKAFDRFHRGVEESQQQPGGTADPAFEQAYRLVTSPEAKQAFDLASEPAAIRNQYGMKTIGQSCLLARRLVERGVPFVTVNNPGWDTHQGAYTRLKEGYTGAKVPVGLIPSLDMAFSALIEDLEQRGLLDETLIVVMGEFGRTPKLNVSGGRDHWPRVFSVAMAGGGVAGGRVVGSSDSVGEGPKDQPVTPADLACTIYSLLGIDPRHLLQTPNGRPIQVNRDGQLIRELVAR
ncbi:MAG: DUF1501 domain-containing protein [Planctomycetia bacterium]|nr:DUF1501 domain-containing protein [Planctomycetia bacterium]